MALIARHRVRGSRPARRQPQSACRATAARQVVVARSGTRIPAGPESLRMRQATSMSKKNTQVDVEALAHAWSWFEVHAQQRIHGINLYLVGFALVMAGYSTLLELKSYRLAGVVAIAGVALSIVFLLLDERNRTLVKAGEAPLLELQRKLAADSGIESMRILENVDDMTTGWRRATKYSWVVRVLTVGGMVWMAISLAFAVGATITQ